MNLPTLVLRWITKFIVFLWEVLSVDLKLAWKECPPLLSQYYKCWWQFHHYGCGWCQIWNEWTLSFFRKGAHMFNRMLVEVVLSRKLTSGLEEFFQLIWSSGSKFNITIDGKNINIVWMHKTGNHCRLYGSKL